MYHGSMVSPVLSPLLPSFDLNHGCSEDDSLVSFLLACHPVDETSSREYDDRRVSRMNHVDTLANSQGSVDLRLLWLRSSTQQVHIENFVCVTPWLAVGATRRNAWNSSPALVVSAVEERGRL